MGGFFVVVVFLDFFFHLFSLAEESSLYMMEKLLG